MEILLSGYLDNNLRLIQVMVGVFKYRHRVTGVWCIGTTYGGLALLQVVCSVCGRVVGQASGRLGEMIFLHFSVEGPACNIQ